MSRYLILLPAPEAEWAKLPESEIEKGMRSHGQFAARGDLIEFRRLAQ
jgi:hypothetical protein